MSAAQSGAEFEVLGNDGEFTLSRVRHPSDGSPTLLVRPIAASPTAASLERLQHAHAIRADLDASWAARPTDLIGSRGHLTLRLEDPRPDRRRAGSAIA